MPYCILYSVYIAFEQCCLSIKCQPFSAPSLPIFMSLKVLKVKETLHLNILTFVFNQDAFHVKPTPKVRQALFCTPGIFREGEAAKNLSSQYDFKKLSALSQLLGFF